MNTKNPLIKGQGIWIYDLRFTIYDLRILIFDLCLLTPEDLEQVDNK